MNGKHHAMEKTVLPVAFAFALCEDKRAMQSFARMSDGERKVVLLRAERARTKADMQLIVSSLSDSVGCHEDH